MMVSPWLGLIPVGLAIVTLILFLVLYFSTPSRRSFTLKKKHAVVTGRLSRIEFTRKLYTLVCSEFVIVPLAAIGLYKMWNFAPGLMGTYISARFPMR